MEAPVALLTGAGGFTGRYLVPELEGHGYRVTGLQQEGAYAAAIDLTDRDAVHHAVRRLSPRVVVHLAAISFVAHGDVESIYRVNVLGTRHLLEALADLDEPPAHVILASSANIYGNAEGMVREDAQPAPVNDYAISKLAMEHVARMWADRLPITIVRPFNYTGIGQSERFLLPKIVSHFREAKPAIELGNLDVWRDFSDVRMVAAAYGRLLQVAPGGLFNICSGRLHSLRDVIHMMAQITGRQIEVQVNPAYVRSNEVKRLCGNPARLHAAVGALPDYDLADTLRWMYESAPAGNQGHK